tara:strand:- start:830 stop:1189 length:360 start_codon:yes stop_codon:yes gene_type:complete
MRKEIESISSDSKNTVIFLSLRQIYLLNSTYRYLYTNKIIRIIFQILLVNSIYDKIKILKIIRKVIRTNIYYYDDMSYNHEYGEVKFYNKVIKQIQEMNINYFNYEKIIKIQTLLKSDE